MSVTNNPLLPRAPEQTDLRTRRFIDLASAVLNSMLREGHINIVGPGEFELDPALAFGNRGGRGSQGRAGRDGSRVFMGSGPPATDLGNETDVYFDRALKGVWQKKTMFFGHPPKWVFEFGLYGGFSGEKGEKGERGERGLKGPRGFTGDTGATGATGATGPAAADPAGSQATRVTSQTIPDATTTAITFTAAALNDAGYWSGGAPTRLTSSVAGWHTLGAHVKWAASTTGKRVMDILVNGVTFAASTSVGPNAGNDDPDQQICVPYKFGIGDYAELTVYQNSTGNLDVTAAQMQMVQA